jgi:hypothetical protein
MWSGAGPGAHNTGRAPLIAHRLGQARRNLTKGQQAMASAMIYPESGKGARGHKDEALNPERLRHRSLLLPQSEKPDKTHPEAEDHNSDKDPYDERAMPFRGPDRLAPADTPRH